MVTLVNEVCKKIAVFRKPVQLRTEIYLLLPSAPVSSIRVAWAYSSPSTVTRLN